MLVNLSDVFASTDRVQQLDAEYSQSEFSDGVQKYRILEKTVFPFTFTNIGTGKVRIETKGCVTLQMACARCLTEVDVPLQLEIVREVYAPDQLTEDDADEQNFVQDYSLQVDDLINNEILLSLPTRVLCKPDCKGICMKCGQNLNLGECGCDTFVPDPRMVAIKDIFNASKEV